MKKKTYALLGAAVMIVTTGLLLRICSVNHESAIKRQQQCFFGVDGLWYLTIDTIEKCRDTFGEPLRTDFEYKNQGELAFTILV